MSSVDKAKKAAYDREYQRRNKEKLAAKAKARRDKEPAGSAAARTRAWREANPERFRAQRAAYLAANKARIRERIKQYNIENKEEISARRRQKYTGWTSEQYREKLAEQGGRCAICGVESCSTGKAFAADHCHKTGKTRGVLCQACNTGIGKLGDSLEGIMRAAHYLARYETETSYEPATHVPNRSSLGPERIDTGRPACEPWQG